jgi:exodeoxyribonuclease III
LRELCGDVKQTHHNNDLKSLGRHVRSCLSGNCSIPCSGESCLQRYFATSALLLETSRHDKVLRECLSRAGEFAAKLTTGQARTLIRLSLSRLVGRGAPGVKDRVTTAVAELWRLILGAKGDDISTVFIEFFKENQNTQASVRELVGKFVYPLVSEKPAQQWHLVLQEAGLDSPPVVREFRQAASWHVGRKGKEAPASFMSYNVNGLMARWERAEGSNGFQTVVKVAEYPDVLCLQETKCTLTKLLRLPGFSIWCREHGYDHVYVHWTKADNHRGGVGYAGVAVLSKCRATEAVFGMQVDSSEARVMHLKFGDLSVVNVYAPCVGYDPEAHVRKKLFFNQLSKFLKAVAAQNKNLVLCGDLNVNPRRQDWHEKAFIHMRSLREKSAVWEHPAPRRTRSTATMDCCDSSVALTCGSACTRRRTG